MANRQIRKDLARHGEKPLQERRSLLGGRLCDADSAKRQTHRLSVGAQQTQPRAGGRSRSPLCQNAQRYLAQDPPKIQLAGLVHQPQIRSGRWPGHPHLGHLAGTGARWLFPDRWQNQPLHFHPIPGQLPGGAGRATLHPPRYLSPPDPCHPLYGQYSQWRSHRQSAQE